MNGTQTTLARICSRIRREAGFTLIELLLVVVLVGIISVAFEATYSAVADRSSQVSTQNILQTEVRASLNQLVSDLRDAVPAPTATSPTPNAVLAYGANSVTITSPDRQSPPHMRRIRYFVTGRLLQRQVTVSTNTSSPWAGIDSDSGPVETLFGTLQNPSAVFKYCVQSPPDMAIDPSNATSPDLITWSCQAPTSAAQIKTVVIRTAISTLSTSTTFNYGDVATLRWNAS